MKESMKVMPGGKALILFNTRRKKAMETFNSPVDLINYVNSLDKKRLMTTKRKNELLKYLQED